MADASSRIGKLLKRMHKENVSQGWIVSSLNSQHSGHAKSQCQPHLRRADVNVEEIREDANEHGIGLRNIQSRLRARNIDVTGQQLRNLISSGRDRYWYCLGRCLQSSVCASYKA